jgi:ribosomal protein S18 acetylase RimI-like enzyme
LADDQLEKGIGSAMLTYALNLAQSMGYKNAVLQASQDGIELYKKMGFQTFTQYFEFA